MSSLTVSRFPALLKEHPDAVATVVCGILVFLGWLTLQSGWLGMALLILPVAYVIGGYESAREGLTTVRCQAQVRVATVTKTG